MKQLLIGFLGISVFLGGCAAPKTTPEAQVNVYSARHYDVDQAILADFESETGIKVNLIEGTAAELLVRLEREKEDPVADVFITVGAENLSQALQEEVLADLPALTGLEAVESTLKGMKWVGITQRARVIVYDKTRTTPTLSTYEELADPQYANQILVRSSTSSYNLAWVSDLIQRNGVSLTATWADGVVRNFARVPTGNDRDQAKGVVAGLGTYAILNTYYLALLANSADPLEVAVAAKLGVIFPQDTHVNLSWAGIVNGAKNPNAAQALIEYLLSVESQTRYTEDNGEYPVRRDVEPSDFLKALGELPAYAADYERLGERSLEALTLFDAVRWP
jgi:iron(III) transport system substrate-binding protein